MALDDHSQRIIFYNRSYGAVYSTGETTMHTIVADELVHDWNALLAGVQRGQSYVIQHKGKNLAVLGPCPLPPSEPGSSQMVGTVRDQLVIDALGAQFRLFGARMLAKFLGLPIHMLLQVGDTGLLNAAGRARLAYLQQLSTHLSGRFTSKEVQRWMNGPQKDLKGRSPMAALGGFWYPDAPKAQAIMALAQVAAHV